MSKTNKAARVREIEYGTRQYSQQISNRYRTIRRKCIELKETHNQEFDYILIRRKRNGATRIETSLDDENLQEMLSTNKKTD